MPVPSPTHPLYWPLQIGGWLLYCAVGFATAAGLSQQDPADSAVLALSGGSILLLSTHALRGRARQAGWSRLSFGRLIPRLLGSCLLIAIYSQLLVSAMLYWPLHVVSTEQPYSIAMLALYVFQTLVILMLWCLIYFSFHAIRNYKSEEIERWRLQAAMKEAELTALIAQINPHFIFNCLNNIRSLVIEDPEKAREAITRLSDLLRYSIRFSEKETVPLSQEIEIVQDYLALEKIHLERRLSFEIDLDPDTLDLQIPPMAVQLLVENAIKHSINTLPEGGSIRIRSRQLSGRVEIEVSNTGQLSRPDNASSGIGLRNARARLRLVCGESASLELRAQSSDTVTARLTIPSQTDAKFA